MSWSIDGTAWNIPCTIKRVSEMTPSEISGMMLDGSYFNDVIGTFLKYDIVIAVPFGKEAEYNSLYETLNSPADGHTCILPYGSSTIQITGRIENVSDEYVRLAGGKTYWRKTAFTVIANHPTKYEELGAVIARGRSPMPDVATPTTGQAYSWSGTAWVEVTDADNIYY